MVYQEFYIKTGCQPQDFFGNTDRHQTLTAGYKAIVIFTQKTGCRTLWLVILKVYLFKDLTRLRGGVQTYIQSRGQLIVLNLLRIVLNDVIPYAMPHKLVSVLISKYMKVRRGSSSLSHILMVSVL